MERAWMLAAMVCAAGLAQGQTAPRVAQSPAIPGVERLLAGRPAINRTITLDDAVRIALRESPALRAADADVDAAVGRLNAARAEERPWVSVNAFASGGSETSIVAGPPGTQPQMLMALPRGAFADGNIMLMYPLYTGGRLSAMVREGSAARDAVRSDLAAQEQEVTLMVRVAYRQAVARQSLAKVAQDRLAENQERLRVDREKYAQGSVALVTVRRDEAEVAAAQQEATNAQRDVGLSLVQLRTVMGISPESRLELSDSNGYTPRAEFLSELIGPRSAVAPAGPGGTPQPELSALLHLAEQQRPELQAAEQRLRGARADVSAAASAFLPQVSAFAMGDVMQARGADTFAGATFGVAASLPLYNGGQRRAKVHTAEAEQRKQEQELETAALQVAQEVNTAYLALGAAEQNIQTSRVAQTAAEEGYRVALERYQAGRSIQVEVLDALAARSQAESSVAQALFDYNVAQDQLRRAVGASLPHR